MKIVIALILWTRILVEAISSPHLILTELADPNDKTGARYVEIYSKDGAGQTINNSSLYLVRWTNANAGITTSTAISLNNLTIGSDHFLVICVPLAANYNFSGYPSGTCNKVVGTGGPADSDGNDKIAIVSGVPAGNFSIIDIYGVPGEVSNTTTGHFFQKGHAVRVAGRTTPKSAWDRNDWISKSYVTTMMTPRQWDAELVASPTSSPASTPVSSKPTSIPTLAPTFGCDSSIQDVTSGIKSIGQKVTICSGFVTAIVYNGFFIQESPSSSGSSSGLFIFTNTGGSKPQFIGMGIKVTGTIALYNGMMELISPQFTVLPTTKTFEAISIKLPVADFSVFNAYQGMLVDIVADTSYSVVVSEFYNLDRFGEVVVCAADANVGRLYQYSSTNLPNVTGYSNHLDLLKRSCVSIDDNSNVQNPKPIRFGGLYPVSTNDFHLRGGQIVTKLKGPLWTNTAYNKYYYVMTLNQQDLSVDPSVNPRPPTPAVIVDSGDIKVVSSNLLNYFTTLNVRGANSAVEFERQVQKTLSALNALNADVYAFTELENSAGNPAVNDLVARLNAANPSRFYVATSVLANLTLIGDDAIKCDIVFDSTLFDLVGWAILTDDQVPQDILSNSTLGCVYCASRVPIAASLRHKLSGNNVTVVTNHLKSKGNTENNAVGKDLDQMDGAALFNYIRLLSVQALLRWLDTNPTGVSTDMVLLAGDFNSYDKEDPLMYLRQQGYTSVADLFYGRPYSYLFDGQFGDLDYIFIKNVVSHKATAAYSWHVNSDEADLIDYNLDYGRDSSLFNGTVPWRFSDHDPIVLIMSLIDSPTALPSINPSRSPSTQPPSICADNPSGEFTLPSGVTKTCSRLATKFSPKRRERICSNPQSNAALICQDTCRGVCHNLSCSDDPTATFGKHHFSCSRLAKVPRPELENICQSYVSAQINCPATCSGRC